MSHPQKPFIAQGRGERQEKTFKYQLVILVFCAAWRENVAFYEDIKG